MAKKPTNDNDGDGSGADYEVGFGKPPRHSQFPAGKSGNPIGRRRGSRGLKTDLLQELAAIHTIHINGRPVKGTRQQLMIMTLATRAASGDVKAAALLLPLIQQLMIMTLATRAASGDVKAAALLLPLIQQVVGTEDRGTGVEQLSAPDQALLDFMIAYRGAEPSPELDADMVGEVGSGANKHLPIDLGGLDNEEDPGHD